MPNFASINGRPLDKYDVLSPEAQEILARFAPQFADSPVYNVAEYLLYTAQRDRDNAGMSGSLFDGGASTLEAIVEAWVSGMLGEMPTTARVVKAIEAYHRDRDPEFAEYQRLHAKFGK